MLKLRETCTFDRLEDENVSGTKQSLGETQSSRRKPEKLKFKLAELIYISRDHEASNS